MPKPPASPPHSDLDGVHRDGTRPGKMLPPHGQDGADLEKAAREDVARPDHSDAESADDRTG